jgi:MFS family permease
VTTDAYREAVSSTSYGYRMLLVLWLGWSVVQGGRFLLSPLLPRIRETLGLSPAVVGLALTVYGLTYAVIQYPSGSYSDSLSRATLLLPGFLVLLVSFVFVGVAVHPALFMGGVVLLGVGKGLFASPSRALLGDLFGDRRGRALGLYTTGTDVGGLLAAGLAVVVLTTTWRAAFVPVVGCLAVATALFVVWNREGYTTGRGQLDTRGTVSRIVATPAQRERLVAYALFYVVVGGLTNFYPTLLVARGFDEALASSAFALFFAVGVVTKPFAGAVSDRFSRLLVSAVGLVVAAAGTGVLLLDDSFVTVVVGTALTGLGYKTQFPIADAVVMEGAPAENQGEDLGAARGVFIAASAVGPGFVGVVAQFDSYTTAFWALVVCLLVAAGVLARQYRR